MFIPATVIIAGTLSSSAALAAGKWPQLRACASVADKDQRLVHWRLR